MPCAQYLKVAWVKLCVLAVKRDGGSGISPCKVPYFDAAAIHTLPLSQSRINRRIRLHCSKYRLTSSSIELDLPKNHQLGLSRPDITNFASRSGCITLRSLSFNSDCHSALVVLLLSLTRVSVAFHKGQRILFASSAVHDRVAIAITAHQQWLSLALARITAPASGPTITATTSSVCLFMSKPVTTESVSVFNRIVRRVRRDQHRIRKQQQQQHQHRHWLRVEQYRLWTLWSNGV